MPMGLARNVVERGPKVVGIWWSVIIFEPRLTGILVLT